MITSSSRDNMGVGIFGYKTAMNDASCSRGTFNVLLDTMCLASQHLLTNKVTKKEFEKFLSDLKEEYKVDVLEKLTTYKGTEVVWSGTEIYALREYLNYIESSYMNVLMNEYKDCVDDLLFYIKHFIRFKYTVWECDILYITL